MSWFCQNCILLFRGTFEQNNFQSRRFGFFVVLARFFKHGLPKVYSPCPEEIFAEFYSQNHIKWHGERKKSAGFVRTAFYFPEELSSKTILVYYSLPDFSRMGCQNCSLRVLKHFLRTFFSQNHTNWPCERKNSAGFVKTAFYFSEELPSKTFLVYYSLADSASMGCKICILRVQRKFLRNFIHRIILVGTLSEKIQLVLSKLLSIFPGNFWAKQFSKSSIWFFSSPCQILQAWVAKIVFYVSRGTFRGIFFTESY